MHNIGETVAAASTPPGKGGVALIRVSGTDAFAIADRVFRPRCGRALSQIAPRMQTYGDIFYENEPIDDGMAVRFTAPHSYTGEDTVEITCHGGVRLTSLVLTALIAAGARAAQAGEFTRRAFLNGRLTLTDAEAIGNLLEAGSLGQIRLSRKSARTRLSQSVDAIRASLVSLMSSLYARIDYPDEDLGELGDAELLSVMQAQREAMDALLSTYRTGHAVVEGVRTVLCGKPNTGKSTLFNRLVGEDAAIVTDVAGTTRDVLEHTAAVGSVLLRLCDTAGLHDSTDPVERIGIDRARARLGEAELILAVFDGSRPMDAEDAALLDTLRTLDVPRIAILNKADLGTAASEHALSYGFEAVLPLCARDGELSALTAVIERLFTEERLLAGECAVLTGERQHGTLLRARELLDAAIDALLGGMPADAVSSDLQRAIGALSELDGREVSEQIVADIFSKFCVGK